MSDNRDEMTSDRIPRYGWRSVYEAMDVQHGDPAELADAEVTTALRVECYISSMIAQRKLGRTIVRGECIPLTRLR